MNFANDKLAFNFHNDMSTLKWNKGQCSPVIKSESYYRCNIKGSIAMSDNNKTYRFTINRRDLSYNIVSSDANHKDGDRQLESWSGTCEIFKPAPALI